MMGPWCKNPLFSRDSLHKGPIMQICNGFLVVGGISFWTNSQVAIEMRYLNSLVTSPTSRSWAFSSDQNIFLVGFGLHVHNISMKEGPRGWGAVQYRISMQNSSLNPNLIKSDLPIAYLPLTQSFWNFAQNTAVILPCSVQNSKNDWTTETVVMDERDVRFEFMICFGQISYIAEPSELSMKLWVDEAMGLLVAMVLSGLSPSLATAVTHHSGGQEGLEMR